MTPLEFCVRAGTEVVFNKTGHNVVPMATQEDYDNCANFLGENPGVGNNVDPWRWQADSEGLYYWACGVGSHCSAGGMKAKVEVATDCVRGVSWAWGMPATSVCVQPGTRVEFQYSGSSHNVVQLASRTEFDSCSIPAGSTSGTAGPFTFQADSPGTFYFACGVGAGVHCSSGGMKAEVVVSDTCFS